MPNKQEKRVLECSGNEPRFLFSVASPDMMPEIITKEIAFFGASNVGKSSLINALCNRKSFAKTSKTPGRTQLVNFFFIPKNIILADVPGYGFANVPKEVQKNWQDLLLGYLESRQENLKGYILVDSRRFFKDSDMDIMKIFQQFGINYKVVITKLDKLNKTEKTELFEKLKNTLNGNDSAIMTSSKDKIGIDDLKKDIELWVN